MIRVTGLIFLASSVLAEIVPTTPTEDQIFQTGDQCTMSWTPDSAPDGWKSMRIDLMTGNAPTMVTVTEVATSVDSTSSGPGWYSWTCPSVDFDGPVYSYMYTPDDGPDPPVFSSQFTITGFNGSLADPGSSVGAPVSAPTDVADTSGGAAHIGNPGPNSSSGEEMLEDVDPALGGSDSDANDNNAGPNFLQQAAAEGTAGPAVTNGRVVLTGAQPTPFSANGAAAAVSTTTETRMLTVPSVSMSASASVASPSISHVSASASASAGLSFKQTGSMNGAITFALFALCAGHFFNE